MKLDKDGVESSMLRIVDKLKKIVKNNEIWIQMAVVFIVAPFLSFWTIETMAETSIYDMTYAFGLLNLLCYIIVYGILFCLIKSTRYTLIVGGILFYLIGTVNYFVLQFRACPVLPFDFYSIKTAVSVAGNFHYKVTLPFLFGSAITLGIILLAFFMKNRRFKNTWKRNLVMIGGVVFVIAIWYGAYFKTDLLENSDVRVDAWIQKNGYARCGFLLSFTANTKYLMIEKPDDYSVEKMQKNLETYMQETGEGGKDKEISALAADEKPNIIAIMDESFSDLSVVGDFKTNKDYMPFIRSLKENTVKGNLHVSVKAGGTCNTEFEFLTGNSLAFLPQGSIAYQQYVKFPYDNLTRILEDQGYDNVGIHPYFASGWNRNTVYPLLGFKKFITLKDFDDSTVYYRNYVSDKSSFERVKKEFEQRKDNGPVFIFNVTMQNHSGYGQGVNGFVSDIRAEGSTQYAGANEYLSIIRKTDDSVKELIEYFKKEKKPTLIVFFGDHQPGIEEGFFEQLAGKSMEELSLAELQNRYTVPFFIWANYDIEEKDMGTISPNYLSSLLLKTAGLKLPEYNQFLLKAMEHVPSVNAFGYVGSDGKNYELKEKSQYSDLLNLYNSLQYNNMFDRKKKVESLFSLNGQK